MVADFTFSRKDFTNPSYCPHMTDADLLALDKNGLIPGPGETQEEFFQRADASKQKFEEGSWIPEPHWDWVRTHLYQMYAVKPFYICAFYSSRNLAPWQGAASWIQGRQLDSIQLRMSLRRGSYLGLYDREEILAHEAVHAARSGFQESRFEEFFAYMTSQKKWCRLLGPIVRKPWEVWPFLLFSLAGMFLHGFYLAALLWLFLGLIRLYRTHRVLKRAGREILQCVAEKRRMRSILFRLSDAEIVRFARGGSIRHYAKEQKELRWRVIQAYLKGDG